MIFVGSKNPAKLEGVRLATAAWPRVMGEVIGCDVPSGVAEQPFGWEIIVRGAENRARATLTHRDSLARDVMLGIESGLVTMPGEPGILYDVCACAIMSLSRRPVFGFSMMWRLPDDATELLLRGRGTVTLDDAFRAIGRTSEARLGYGEGAIGLLSGGTITRATYTAQAVSAALAGWSPL